MHVMMINHCLIMMITIYNNWMINNQDNNRSNNSISSSSNNLSKNPDCIRKTVNYESVSTQITINHNKYH